ncbi:hypothetical protein RCL1_002541 [Eukaryota sp. TZLM3-RCL]
MTKKHIPPPISSFIRTKPSIKVTPNSGTFVCSTSTFDLSTTIGRHKHVPCPINPNDPTGRLFKTVEQSPRFFSSTLTDDEPLSSTDYRALLHKKNELEQKQLEVELVASLPDT